MFKLTYNGLLLASMPKSLRRIRSVSEGSMEALCAQNVLRNGQRQVVLADCAALGKENLHNAQMRREMMANGTYVEGSYPPVDFGYIHYNSILKGGGYETLYMNK